MQTTLRINDDVYRRAKAKSGELGLSLTRFFEEAVEERLQQLEGRSTQRMELPVSTAAGSTIRLDALKERMARELLDEDLKSLQ